MRWERRRTSGLDLPSVLLWSWLASAPFGLAASPAGAETLVVAATLDDAYLAQDLMVVRHQGRLYLPVVEFGALLLIPFESTDDGNLSADVTSTGTKVAIDLEVGVLVVDDAVLPLETSDALFVDGSLFLAEDVIETIIPVELEFYESAMHLNVSARKPLPIQVREKQEQLRERLLRPPKGAKEARRIDVPYSLFSAPVGDLSVGMGWSSDGHLQRSYDALVGAEVGTLTTQAFISGNEERPLTELRLKAGRESPDGGAFGVDGVTEAWVGDVREPVLPLLGGGAVGRGVMVSGAPLDRPDSFDTTTIDGDAQPGWDVELYHNEMLIAHQKVDALGRYAFEDVPLFYGQNRFRLVYYGPQGQLREEERRFTVGGDMISPGETHWSLFAGQPDTRVAAPLLDRPEADDDAAFSLEIEHGLGRNVSLGGFAARTRTSAAAEGDLATSGGIVGRVSWDNLLVRADAAVQEGGGYGIGLSGLYALDSLSLSGRYARYRNFRSIAASDGLEPLAATASLRVQHRVRRTPVGAVTLGVRGEHRSYVNGRDQYSAGVDIRHKTGRLHVNHQFDIGLTTYGEENGVASPAILYNPSVSFLRDPIVARGSALFDLADGGRLDQLATSLRYRLNDETSLGAEVAYALGSDLGQLNLSYARRFQFAQASASAAVDTNGDVTVGVAGSFSFGLDRGGRPLVTGHRLAERGALSPFVYHDGNANGRFDPGEDTPLADVGFRLDGNRRPAVRTRADGGALVGAVSSSRPLTIALDEATLPDPFWVASDGPVEVQPRRGRLMAIDIPVVDSGEVSGTVVVRRAGRDWPLRGVLVQLDRQDGRIVSDLRTDVYGFYLFEGLVPGRYVVRVPPGQDIEGVAIRPARMAIELKPGGVLEGRDIRLDLEGELDTRSFDDDQRILDLLGAPVVGEGVE